MIVFDIFGEGLEIREFFFEEPLVIVGLDLNIEIERVGVSFDLFEGWYTNSNG